MIRYARDCSLYSDFLHRHRLLSTKLLNLAVLKNRRILIFKLFVFREDINILLKSMLSLGYIWRKIVLAIIFCIPKMSVKRDLACSWVVLPTSADKRYILGTSLSFHCSLVYYNLISQMRGYQQEMYIKTSIYLL